MATNTVVRISDYLARRASSEAMPDLLDLAERPDAATVAPPAWVAPVRRPLSATAVAHRARMLDHLMAQRLR